MGCKSPVSMSNITIKSLVKHKGEVVRLSSGSSVDQRHEPMNKNVIGGMCNGMSGPRIAKSFGPVACVNGAVVCRRFNSLSGEASNCGLRGLQCANHLSGTPDSNVRRIAVGGVSRRHSSRGDELARGRTDSRSGEGLKSIIIGTHSVDTSINADRSARTSDLCLIQLEDTSTFVGATTALKQTA